MCKQIREVIGLERGRGGGERGLFSERVRGCVDRLC